MALSKEEKARRKKEKRDRKEQRALDAGLSKKEARALRDRSDKRVNQEIRDFILKNMRPPINPSDLSKEERKKYIPLSKDGEGYLILGWRDKTETVSGKYIINTKMDFKGDSIPSIYTQVYGNRKTGAKGYIDQQGLGEFGVIETEITKTEEGKKKAERSLRQMGFTILYSGKCLRRSDLIPVIGALSLGFYSKDEKRAGIYHFILQIQKVNPSIGKELREEYHNYYGRGY